jgi:signal transduction histidine kinase
MRLADFIVREMEPILAQWEAFAATCVPASNTMNSLALRDHARQILEAIAKDLTMVQTREEQFEKSMGRAPMRVDAAETAAQTHAMLRAQSGFDIRQLTAEYRALRASVLRLWLDTCLPSDPHLDDMIRFNEAIDQALAESVGFFSAQVDQARNLLLGMLGHDMRSPLQTIQMTASYLAKLNAGETVSAAASRLIHSGAQIQALLDDLVDFNRTNLGLGINIVRSPINIGELLERQVKQLEAAHPGRRIHFEAAGDTSGSWDGVRLQQVVGNLVENAFRYGEESAPVHVRVRGGEAELRLDIENSGSIGAPAKLDRIFEPLRRGPEHQQTRDPHGSNLGLGLYIAREIAKAHGGDIAAQSTTTHTLFTVTLPRQGAGA